MDGSNLNGLDLSTLQVNVCELRLSADGTWLYLLQVACSHARWLVPKRYSEIRELWLEITKVLGDNMTKNSCNEHCHFLAGLEQDKFPKKHLLLTQHKLEARASELNQFFLKLVMRLNLCNPSDLQTCRLRGCPLLTLIVHFLKVDTEQAKNQVALSSSRSISIQRVVRRQDQHFTSKRRSSLSISLGLGRRLLVDSHERHTCSSMAAYAQ
ncbi:Phox homologous domain [Plasmopara halstedii]|uniref:Phox homologous domain n=1 Tax=Plasmopara halstedii TaxID=4781 RepID=A0A0N7L4V7_PLAHL|nr:Phox homologous domain [Plasmopara halstedii]CEG39747.1 Phox homologous domain [Plasmopara halstedii]|eukprot:XP_024576116.1 Phox homologous domain [Plasmopara halstedii]